MYSTPKHSWTAMVFKLSQVSSKCWFGSCPEGKQPRPSKVLKPDTTTQTEEGVKGISAGNDSPAVSYRMMVLNSRLTNPHDDKEVFFSSGVGQCTQTLLKYTPQPFYMPVNTVRQCGEPS